MRTFDREKFRKNHKYQAEMLKWLAENHIELMEHNYSFEEIVIEIIKYLDVDQASRLFDDITLERNEEYL